MISNSIKVFANLSVWMNTGATLEVLSSCDQIPINLNGVFSGAFSSSEIPL
ncbi:hypothetical protein ACR34G_02855 [Mycoplasma sp. 480]|uniref:hypothetical protein n=1 Tax=Mycoplasma sp. 480 TaxID=3440155 RepID=UPI003F51601F